MWGRGPASDHVLVTTADVGGEHLQDRAVRAFPPDVVRVHTGTVAPHEAGVVEGSDLYVARPLVGDAAVLRHGRDPSSESLCGSQDGGVDTSRRAERPSARWVGPP